MNKNSLKIFALALCASMVISTAADARPPWRHHHHRGDWIGGVIGGAAALGLGLGIAGAISGRSPSVVVPAVPVAPPPPPPPPRWAPPPPPPPAYWGYYPPPPPPPRW